MQTTPNIHSNQNKDHAMKQNKFSFWIQSIFKSVPKLITFKSERDRELSSFEKPKPLNKN